MSHDHDQNPNNVLHLRGLLGFDDDKLFKGHVPMFGRNHYVYYGEAPQVVGPVWIPDEGGFIFKMKPPRRVGPEGMYRPTVIPDDYEAEVQIEPGEDPHVAFYRVANKFREHLARETEKIADEITDWDAGTVDLVTVAFTPIIAVPKDDRGFYLMATVGQFACQTGCVVGAHDKADPSTKVDGAEVLENPKGSLISTNGDFPIKPPNNIEMQLLIRLDDEVIRRELKGDDARNLMVLYKNKVVHVRGGR